MGRMEKNVIAVAKNVGQLLHVLLGSDPVGDDTATKTVPGATPAPTAEAVDQDEEQEQRRSQRAHPMLLAR